MTLMQAGPKTLTNPWLDQVKSVADFAAGIRPIQVVSTLPSSGMTEGDIAYLTTDNKLYRYTGSAWSKTIYATDLGDQVQAGQLAANSVTAGTIAAGAISATELAVGAVSETRIANGAITTNKIYAGAVTAEKLSASYIQVSGAAADVNAGTTTISGGKITAASIAADRLTASYVQVSGAAADINAGATTIDGGKITADTIDVGQLKADCITADKINVGAVEYTHMAAGAVSADRGDPSGYDFTSFTQDGTWRDLDLSSIVPVGYRFVLLRGLLNAASVGNLFHMRKKGNTYTQNAAVHSAPVASAYLSAEFFVACDANRKVQYMAQSGHFTSINLYVAAYWP